MEYSALYNYYKDMEKEVIAEYAENEKRKV